MEPAALDTSLYEDDYITWVERQAALIRQGRFEAVGLENVAGKIADLGRSRSASLEAALPFTLAQVMDPEFWAGRST